MKEVNWRVPLFIVFIFLFAIGLSYLVLNEKKESDKDTIKMSIDLVNEDDGVNFNEQYITMGDDFANSVIKNTNHEWYIVSRGVAESGFDRNLYDMLIIIPNNFSERALSINELSPKKVTLQYKINATGHDEVRAEAEKVASRILNDFNQRLIDVYFASIIGNLQEAQDNITDIIKKEEKYTNLFIEQIQEPLGGYTKQFQSIQDYSDLSKESYSVLEELIQGFQTELIDESYNKQQYVSELNHTMEKKNGQPIF